MTAFDLSFTLEFQGDRIFVVMPATAGIQRGGKAHPN